MTADSKKKKEIIALSVLGVLALYLVYTNVLAGPSIPASDHVPAATANAPGAPDVGPAAMPGIGPRKAPMKGGRGGRGRDDAFHPIYVATRPEDRPDVTGIDPTLHLDLLAKVQGVDAAGGIRNLFAFGKEPPPKPVEALKPEPTVKLANGKAGDKNAKAAPPPPKDGDGKPGEVPLKIDLKYYGIIAYSRSGRKTACFMDGDQILTATEGDTLKRRYRVVRIGTNSVVMEDTESKRQATLPIAKEAQG